MGKQQTRIILHLYSGGELTSLDAWKEYGISRLAARISELRNLGFPIKGKKVESENKFGEPTHFMAYYMKADEIPKGLTKFIELLLKEKKSNGN